MSKYLKYTKKVKELMPDLADAEHTAHELYGSEYLNTDFAKLKKKILQRQNYKTKKLLDSLP